MNDQTAIKALNALRDHQGDLDSGDRDLLTALIKRADVPPRSLMDEVEAAYVWLLHRFVHRRKDWPIQPLSKTSAATLIATVPLAFILGFWLHEAAFVVVGVLVVVAIAVDRSIRGRRHSLAARSNAGHCRGCAYDLSGLEDGIRFPPDITDPPRSGPHLCPECARPWPLLV